MTEINRPCEKVGLKKQCESQSMNLEIKATRKTKFIAKKLFVMKSKDEWDFIIQKRQVNGRP